MHRILTAPRLDSGVVHLTSFEVGCGCGVRIHIPRGEYRLVGAYASRVVYCPNCSVAIELAIELSSNTNTVSNADVLY